VFVVCVALRAAKWSIQRMCIFTAPTRAAKWSFRRGKFWPNARHPFTVRRKRGLARQFLARALLEML
jgi:hypothetical protein